MLETVSKIFSIASFFLCLCFPASASAQSPEEFEGIELGYSGKYSGEAFFQRILLNLRDSRRSAVENARQFLGIPTEAQEDVFIVRFEDLPEGVRLFGRTSSEEGSEVARETVTLYTEYLASNLVDVQEELDHEVVHALLRLYLGGLYRDLPAFVREGLAVLGANQIESRTKIALAEIAYQDREIASLLDGVDDPDHGLEDYVEEGLFFSYLAGSVEGFVQTFVRELKSGTPWRESIEKVSGATFDDLKAEFETFAKAHLESEVSTRAEDFKTARAAYTDGDDASASDMLKKIADDENAGYLIVPATYLLGKSLYRARKYSESVDAFKRVRGEFKFFFPYQDDSQYYLAKALLQLRRLRDSELEFIRFERDFVFAPDTLKAQAAYFHGELLNRQGREIEALSKYEFARSVEQPYRDDAYFRCIEASVAQEDFEKARALLAEFRELFENSSLLEHLEELVPDEEG
ncbi:MAG: hypothetical protein NUW37_07735 [Planctomycetes bacterium]|nr:hypothetical protein [Planctomycetota bacterium]